MTKAAMKKKLASDKELTEEAKRWDERKLTPLDWEDAPEAVPCANESMLINIQLPRSMVAILKEFARRAGVGYQVLLKQWLDDRIRQESQREAHR